MPQQIHVKVINALNRYKTMEKLIEFLRTLDFVFVQMTEDLDKLQLHKKYGWMVREREDKDKPDLTIMVGIKMWGKKNDKVIIYLRGKWFRTLKAPWKDKADINFRKTVNRLKFPDYLHYDDRRKWRTEHHKQLKNPNRVPSQWYLNILPDIQFS